MTTKYGTGKIYDFLTSPDADQRPAPGPARPRLDRQHLRLQDVVAPHRADLQAHRRRQDRRAGRLRPLLHAAHRRVPATVRSRHAPREPDLPDVRGRALERRRHQRRRVHRHRPRPRTRPARSTDLTPISEEQHTIDYSWTLNVAPNVKDQHTDEFTFNFEREIAQNFSVAATYIYKHTDRPVRQHPHQPGDGPGVGVRADPVHDLRRPAREALQRRAQGLQRRRRGRQRRRRVGRRQQHLPGSEHAEPSTASSPSATTRRCSSSSRSGIPTDGRRWRRSCTRSPTASPADRSGRTSTSRARCSTTTTGWARSTTRSTT